MSSASCPQQDFCGITLGRYKALHGIHYLLNYSLNPSLANAGTPLLIDILLVLLLLARLVIGMHFLDWLDVCC